MAKHVHCEVIKAWAEGALIEWRAYNNEEWKEITVPSWYDGYQYRVKPEKVFKWIALYSLCPGSDYYNTLEEAKRVRPSAIKYVQVQVSP